MVKDFIEKLEGKLYSNEMHHNSSYSNETMNPNFLSNDPMEAKIMIGMALSFYSGLIQVLILKKKAIYKIFNSYYFI